mgnify:CR=1 FL=1
MKAILLDEAKKWLEENCENQYTRMAVFGIMQSMPTVDYQKTPNEPLSIEQLRQMDGQPVWVDDENDKKTWALLQVWGDENIDAVFPMPRGCFHAESVIGKKIYRCPPEEEI